MAALPSAIVHSDDGPNLGSTEGGSGVTDVKSHYQASSVHLTCRSNWGPSPSGGNAREPVRSIQNLPLLRRRGGTQAGRVPASGVRFRHELEMPVV